MNTIGKFRWILHPASNHVDKITYDYAWYKYDLNARLPILTGYFRTGNHWILSLIQNYYNVSYKNKANWAHDEDFNLNPNWSKGVLYIYRKNIFHVMYSLYKAQFSECNINPYNVSFEDFLLYKITDYKFLTNKWMGKENTCICYEHMLSNPVSEFEKITNFFGDELNEKKFNSVYESNTKKIVHNNWIGLFPNYFGKYSKDYYFERDKWINEHKDLMLSCINDTSVVDNIGLEKHLEYT